MKPTDAVRMMVVNLETGAIERTVNCARQICQLQAGEGEVAIEVDQDTNDMNSQYDPDTGQIVPL